MYLTPIQTIIIIIAVTLGTMITRFTPFILFPENKKHPAVVEYLGKILAPAMMGLLIIYCLRNVTFTSGNHGLPEVISIIFIAFLHLWKRNVLLSIGAGTVLYMVLVQVVFA